MTKRQAFIGLAILSALYANAVVSSGLQWGPRETYAVILTVSNGTDYAVDYGLSEADCRDALAHEWPDGRCTRERP